MRAALSKRRRILGHISIANTLFGYQKEWLRPDLVAGLATSAVVIPIAMAHATIAGLPVQVGLYTAFLPMVIYAVLGTSRPLSVSTTTTLSILAANEFDRIAPANDFASLLRVSAMLTLLVGTSLVLASLLRLGFIANFISTPVLVGFKAGIGIVIVMDQVPKILGIHFQKESFLHNLLAIVRDIPEMSLMTFAVGSATLAVLVVIKYVLPRASAPLIAVAVSIAGAFLLNLGMHGVLLVGHIPKGFPPITVPDFSLAVRLWPGALGIALMSFTETIAAGRAFAESGEPLPQANRELIATGLANVGAAFLGAIPAGGGTTQTAVNRLAGARTQLAELITSMAVLATMLFLSPLIALMPQATLAAIVIVYSVGLIRPVEFKAILTIRRTEFFWAVTAFVGVVLLGTVPGILVAIVVSFLALAYQAADPSVYALGRKPGTNIFRPCSKEQPGDETFPGLLLLRLEGRVFFANAEVIGQKIRLLIERSKPKTVVLDFSNVPDLEYTALKMLAEAETRQRGRGVSLWLVGLSPKVLTIVRRSPLGKALGNEAMHYNLELAVAKFLASSATTNAV
jgi:sulfate permease, SulP family